MILLQGSPEKAVLILAIAPRNVASVDQFECVTKYDFEDPNVKRKKCNEKERLLLVACEKDVTIVIEADRDVDQIANELTETGETLTFVCPNEEVLDECPEDGEDDRCLFGLEIVEHEPEDKRSNDG